MKIGGALLTRAQQTLTMLGVPIELILLGHKRGTKGQIPSFTKTGPGRRSAHAKKR